MRHYLSYSSAFNGQPATYHTDLYKAAVKRGGGKLIRTARQFGWSNQPKVVTWEGDERINDAIFNELAMCPPFGGDHPPCPIIHAKNW